MSKSARVGKNRVGDVQVGFEVPAAEPTEEQISATAQSATAISGSVTSPASTDSQTATGQSARGTSGQVTASASVLALNRSLFPPTVDPGAASALARTATLSASEASAAAEEVFILKATKRAKTRGERSTTAVPSQITATPGIDTLAQTSQSSLIFERDFGTRRVPVVGRAQTVTPATGRVERQAPAVAAVAFADPVVARAKLKRALTALHATSTRPD